MAAPAAVLAVKATLAAATDKRGRMAIASVVAAILTPFILIVVVIMSALSGTTAHNNAAVDLAFHGGYLSSRLPSDYRMYIEKMRGSFTDLDMALSDINAMAEDGEVDAYRVKAIFYSLFFGADQPRMNEGEFREFADCFVTYEERDDGEDGTYTVAIPIPDLETVYANLAVALGQSVTAEDKSNAQRIYVLAKYGQVSPENSLPLAAAMGDGSYAALIAEGEQFLGYPYVFGGSTPQTSFDCSGFVCWVYTQSGVYNLPRTTATGIYNQCAIVSRDEAEPGDLIFFTKTYVCAGPVSHVGIYVGNGKMLHCGSPIQYTNIDTNYWREHFYGFGRLPS
ncbi:C40 family peptidase [Clostridiales bacterium BAD-6]|uniref:C40 family peptidase n=1 Tax=Sinanaerobacter chloroacetimidivorans TaxID=2818044 RepID=A0A8J8AZE1_9FIRM|nr:C40 family peptidase [Sinanaerobacter chloroacetimidivorans]MBR0596423.1 C40 family peptidase [Sinanaerobacter chloroacetimidivorans]